MMPLRNRNSRRLFRIDRDYLSEKGGMQERLLGCEERASYRQIDDLDGNCD
jgi:hypothetical protein